MQDFLTLVIVIVLVVACSVLQAEMSKPSSKTVSQDIPRGFVMKTVKLGERDMKYMVYVPPVYDPAKPIPAIIFLNGMGECGNDGMKQIAQGLGTAVMFNADKWPFIIMFPQKQITNGKWEDEDDMVMEILKKTQAEYNIDESRLYLTGISQGGHGTWSIAAKHPDLFAAIAPVCGWGDKEIAGKLSKMPIWVFHGDADEAVPVQASKDMAEHLKAASGSCKLTIYPGVGHNSWDKAYREEKLYEWFLQNKNQGRD